MPLYPPASGGSGAPTTADYLVKTADGGLSAERVVTDTSSVSWDWGTAGQAKAQIANETIVSLSSDATANATTTGVEITGLQASSVGTGTYVFQYFIRYQSNTAGTGVKFAVNHTGTTTYLLANMRYIAVAGSASAATQAGAAVGAIGGGGARVGATTSPNLGPTTSVDTINSDMMCVIDGLVKVTASGDLELWHASEAATSTQVMAGSSLILKKVA